MRYIKNSKNILLLAILLLSILSCDKNDDQQNDPQNPTDGFTINNTFYETPNCYIEFDEDNQDQFNLFFTNGRMADNPNYPDGNTDDYLLSLNTTNWVFYNLTDEENPSIVNPYPNIQTGTTYIGHNSDSVLLYDGVINSFTSPYMLNGTEFGYGDENFGTVYTGNLPEITINSYNFDTTTQTGTIDVDYTFINTQGITITGHYTGTIGVILD